MPGSDVPYFSQHRDVTSGGSITRAPGFSDLIFFAGVFQGGPLGQYFCLLTLH